VTNKKEDILSRVPTKFIKAYPNLKQFVAMKFNDDATEKVVSQPIYETKKENHQNSTLLQLEKIG
jgi:hypothetical protein